MKTKRISPAAAVALREALASIYWYKSDLRSFLGTSLNEPHVLGRLNWSDVKVNIAANVVDILLRDEERYQHQILSLISDVTSITDFSHLERLEDGKAKAARASRAVGALAALSSAHEELAEEQRAAEERRRAVHEELLERQAVRTRLGSLLQEFCELIGPADAQKRGYRLETLLKDLFELFDLDPKASFKIEGEQIDGSFSFDGSDYLLEAKWQNQVADTKELDAFAGKISRKLDNTLGLFLAVNGFAPSAVEAHSAARPSMILMDGGDLMAVLEGRIDLIQLLLRKRRHAAQTGRVFLPIHEVLS